MKEIIKVKKDKKQLIEEAIDECDNIIQEVFLEQEIALIAGDMEALEENTEKIQGDFFKCIYQRKQILINLLERCNSGHRDFLGFIVIGSGKNDS